MTSQLLGSRGFGLTLSLPLNLPIAFNAIANTRNVSRSMLAAVFLFLMFDVQIVCCVCFSKIFEIRIFLSFLKVSEKFY